MLTPATPPSLVVCAPTGASVEHAEHVIWEAIADGLPDVLDALQVYARSTCGPQRSLVISLRQVGLMVLGAVEVYLGRPRSRQPAHLLRR